MVSLQTKRLGGAALILGSVLFIVNKFNDMSSTFLNRPFPDVITGQSVYLLALGQIALVVGFSSLYMLYARQTTRAGQVGLGLLAGGSVLLALGHIVFTPLAPTEFLFLFVILGVFGMVIGLILFGVVNLRRPALAHWQALPLICGLLGAAGFFLSGGSNNPFLFLTLRTLFGASLVLLGVVMLLDKASIPVGATAARI